MPETEYQKYIEEGRRFINSKEAKRYDINNTANQITNILIDVQKINIEKYDKSHMNKLSASHVYRIRVLLSKLKRIIKKQY